ncbi:MAG: hypothetical protein O7J95_11410, partial [Planctomycetota bacterium]|nr:hypothetical protein [Planctomycetota bacterium]
MRLLVRVSLLVIVVFSSGFARAAVDQASCQALADRVLDACARLGVGDEPCARLRDVALESCLAIDAPAPDPQPGPCAILCDLAARGVLQTCIEAGGGDDACRERSEGFRRQCLEGCEGGAPPPPANDCDAACRQRFDRALEACVGADAVGANGALDDECARRARASLGECLRGCDAQDPPPPADDCQAACRRSFDRAAATCVRDDGTVDPECQTRARRSFAACLDRCRPPPPPANDCDAACRRRFDRALETCVGANGALDDECARRARASLGECLRGCDVPEPPSCDEHCASDSKSFLAECVAQGADAGECGARA